ncbi:MAG: MFS transporter [Arcobacteraceae bacterium]|nr:MFS transporter [Arcobacteraceae bacterium]
MKEIKPLMVTNILCVSAMMAFLAVVGPIIRTLNLEEWHAGLTVALAGVAWVFLSRFWGKKSDVYGRKKVLVFAVIGFSVSYLLLALFINYAVISPPVVIFSLLVLILTRGLMGVFYSAVTPVSNALIADKVSPEQRTSYMAKLGAANGLGMILGPVFGALFASYGLAVPLYAAAFMPMIAVLILIRFLPSHTPIHIEKEKGLHYLDKRLRLPMIAAFLTMYSIVTTQICLGFYVIDILKLENIESAKVTGYILAMVGVLFILTQVIVSKLKSIEPKNWLLFGAVVCTFGFIAIALVRNQIELFMAFGVLTLGLGMIMPAFLALTANNVLAHEQGVAAGTVSSAQGLGIIIGPLLSTFLYKFNPIIPFMVAAFAFALLTYITLKHK